MVLALHARTLPDWHAPRCATRSDPGVPAGGALAGTYPSPSLADRAVSAQNLAAVPGARLVPEQILVPSDASTSLPMSFEEPTGSGFYDAKNPTRIDCPITGEYLLIANIGWDTGTIVDNSYYSLSIFRQDLNDGTVESSMLAKQVTPQLASVTEAQWMQASALVECDANSWFDVELAQNTGVGQRVDLSSTVTIRWLGSAP